MRRLSLVLFLVILPSWSQPAQQQVQPPIVINNVPAHDGFWTGLLRLAIPTIAAAALASGITLYGVNKTHKHQATENEASRKHLLQVEIAKAEIAAKYRSEDRRWEFRKDVYVKLINATSGMISANSEIGSIMSDIQQLKQAQTLTPSQLKDLSSRIESAGGRHLAHATVLAENVSLAPLAVAEDVLPLVVKAKPEIFKTAFNLSSDGIALPTGIPTVTKEVRDALHELLRKLQSAGRKDLWGTPESEAKAEAASQS